MKGFVFIKGCLRGDVPATAIAVVAFVVDRAVRVEELAEEIEA